MKRQKLLVAALENGTVIDHIPSNKLFTVICILNLENSSKAITIGYNLKSGKMGSKGIIKVSDKFFSDAELNQLAIVAPNVSLSVIRDFEVIEKKQVVLPSELIGIVKCVNPMCITNNEPMHTHFVLTDRETGVIQCRYCEKKQSVDNVKLL